MLQIMVLLDIQLKVGINMKTYVNITTMQRTYNFIDDSTTILDDDIRVENFFIQEPQGFKRVLVGDTFEFIEIPLPTAEDIEDQRVISISTKATKTIEAIYSPLKQRKLLSIAVALQDKVMQGGTLTTDEEALMQNNRDTNTWITNIRTIENTAITDATLLIDIIWE